MGYIGVIYGDKGQGFGGFRVLSQAKVTPCFSDRQRGSSFRKQL